MAIQRGQRKLNTVPAWVWAGLLICLLLQGLLRASAPAPVAQAKALTTPPSANMLGLLSAGEPVAASRLIMLWLQAFDNQAGISLAYRDLNYDALSAWLQRSSALDSRNPYPLFAATQLYPQGQSEERIRLLIDYTRTQYHKHPEQHWRWMSNAILLAKHKLNDNALALALAKDLNRYKSDKIPSWARQMEILLYEDLGEFETMRYMIGAQLQSGTITDAHELHFLNNKLASIGESSKNRLKQ